mmetsp:Transcript_46032/g.51953  ORF Transcript_46032/g.51953 Transcript_46032/m.51953 type:complete len:84 (-) Transcript_46032:85-336(-)
MGSKQEGKALLLSSALRVGVWLRKTPLFEHVAAIVGKGRTVPMACHIIRSSDCVVASFRDVFVLCVIGSTCIGAAGPDPVRDD